MGLIFDFLFAFFAAMLVMVFIWPPLYHLGKKIRGTRAEEVVDRPGTDDFEVPPLASLLARTWLKVETMSMNHTTGNIGK
ncbi:MAG: hypothetical protein ACLFUU_12445 [Desulfobacteraceae bacterium]